MSKKFKGYNEDWLKRYNSKPQKPALKQGKVSLKDIYATGLEPPLKSKCMPSTGKKIGRQSVQPEVIEEMAKRSREICGKFTKIEIKPLSVNEAWYGKKVRTSAHRKYEEEVLGLLPDLKLGNPPYRITIIFGFSSPRSDLDNPVKILLDCITKKYGFNDKHIYELHVFKEITKKGAEFIQFNLKSINHGK